MLSSGTDRTSCGAKDSESRSGHTPLDPSEESALGSNSARRADAPRREDIGRAISRDEEVALLEACRASPPPIQLEPFGVKLFKGAAPSLSPWSKVSVSHWGQTTLTALSGMNLLFIVLAILVFIGTLPYGLKPVTRLTIPTPPEPFEQSSAVRDNLLGRQTWNRIRRHLPPERAFFYWESTLRVSSSHGAVPPNSGIFLWKAP
jgi:hypothetical protein